MVRRRGQAWRASTGRGLGDRAPLSNFLLVSLTSNCAGRRRAVSVAWPQSRVHARGVRPMHARAVGVGAPDPERGSAALTSSAVGGRRSEGLVRPSTASQPPLRSRSRSARSGPPGLILRQRHATTNTSIPSTPTGKHLKQTSLPTRNILANASRQRTRQNALHTNHNPKPKATHLSHEF